MRDRRGSSLRSSLSSRLWGLGEESLPPDTLGRIQAIWRMTLKKCPALGVSLLQDSRPSPLARSLWPQYDGPLPRPVASLGISPRCRGVVRRGQGPRSPVSSSSRAQSRDPEPRIALLSPSGELASRAVGPTDTRVPPGCPLRVYTPGATGVSALRRVYSPPSGVIYSRLSRGTPLHLPPRFPCPVQGKTQGE
uniref:Uncharacterized protein n=1 Tax=Phaffia rhodozyma TaxID=264483 RepID=Q9HFD8_PHARH|nr:hypothetical protein [Phaffia rhodozyma]